MTLIFTTRIIRQPNLVWIIQNAIIALEEPMHLYDSMKKPVIFGHRGASRYAPENTMASFDLAVRQGARAFELDTMLTSDGIPVVIHDHTLDRTTNGMGSVNQKKYDEIQELDAGGKFSQDFIGEKVPSLVDVLKKFPREILINIELKNYHSPKDELTRIVVEMVESLQMLDRVIFSSFLPRNLRILRKMQPKAKTALLISGSIPGYLLSTALLRSLSPEIVHPPLDVVDHRLVRQEHKNGRCVNVWTVNDPQSARKLIDWGVDGLITDDPLGILELLGQ